MSDFTPRNGVGFSDAAFDPDWIGAATAECSCLRRSDLTAADKAVLSVYECGAPSAPPVLIINPVGVSVLLVSRLARKLAERFRVVTWEQRGFGWNFEAFNAHAHRYSAFQQDVVDVFQQRIAAPCPVVAICSGASLAIKAATRGLIDASAMILVSPAVRFAGCVPSLYEQSAVPFMREIAREGKPLAQLLIKMSEDPLNSQAQSPDHQLIQTADRAYLRSVDSVLIQAHSVAEFYAQTVDEDVEKLTVPVCVMCAQDDEIVAIESARRLVKLIPHAQLLEHVNGGHHAVFLDREAREQLAHVLHSETA
jgi:pimeloyl-ACP methyl ester carboxylesterase